MPVPKVSSPKLLEDDLRLISFISRFAKIMEGFTLGILLRQAINQLDVKELCGCGKSTTHALVYLLQSLDMDNNYAICSLLI